METLVDELEFGATRLALERPCDPEQLLDEEAFARDEFLPYWAELWPSGLALAGHVATLELEGATVLELGCGLGLPSLVAAGRGADVVAVDWAPEAVAFLRRNAVRNGVALDARVADWRHAEQLAGRAFDVVLAADVLYEERNARPLSALLPRVVAEGGRCVLTDPGRRHAAPFFAELERAGWAAVAHAEPLLPHGALHLLTRVAGAVPPRRGGRAAPSAP